MSLIQAVSIGELSACTCTAKVVAISTLYAKLPIFTNNIFLNYAGMVETLMGHPLFGTGLIVWHGMILSSRNACNIRTS